jgi:hypothetical protein
MIRLLFALVSISFTVVTATTSKSVAGDFDSRFTGCVKDTKDVAKARGVSLKDDEADSICSHRNEYSDQDLLCAIDTKRKWDRPSAHVSVDLEDTVKDCKTYNYFQRKCATSLAQHWNSTRGTIMISRGEAYDICLKYSQRQINCTTAYALNLNKIRVKTFKENFGFKKNQGVPLSFHEAYSHGCQTLAPNDEAISQSDSSEALESDEN